MLSQNRRFLTPSPLLVFFLLSKIGNFLPLPPLDDIVYGLPLRGVQQLRWPDFFLFWKPFHQDMDIFYPESGQKLSFLDHLSTSSCPRSYWMITWWNNQLLRQWKAVRLFKYLIKMANRHWRKTCLWPFVRKFRTSFWNDITIICWWKLSKHYFHPKSSWDHPKRTKISLKRTWTSF